VHDREGRLRQDDRPTFREMSKDPIFCQRGTVLPKLLGRTELALLVPFRTILWRVAPTKGRGGGLAGIGGPGCFGGGIGLLGAVTARVCPANHAVVLNLASHPELRAGPKLFHSHRLGATSQVDYIVWILRSVGGNHDIAFDSLTRNHGLMQHTIKAVFADVSGRGAKRVRGTGACQVQGPVEGRPGIPAPFHAGQKAGSFEQRRVCVVSLIGCGKAHYLDNQSESSHFSCHMVNQGEFAIGDPVWSHLWTIRFNKVLVLSTTRKYLDNYWVAMESE
jgi:hypothetical protein